MNVKELKEHLEDLPDEALVMVMTEEGVMHSPESVKVDSWVEDAVGSGTVWLETVEY
jgi:hypothetical protein